MGLESQVEKKDGFKGPVGRAWRTTLTTKENKMGTPQVAERIASERNAVSVRYVGEIDSATVE